MVLWHGVSPELVVGSDFCRPRIWRGHADGDGYPEPV